MKWHYSGVGLGRERGFGSGNHSIFFELNLIVLVIKLFFSHFVAVFDISYILKSYCYAYINTNINIKMKKIEKIIKSDIEFDQKNFIKNKNK